MTLGESRGIWQTIANGVAVECFDADGHVDVERLQTWMIFLGDVETFGEEPFCFIPHAELMRSQMHRVCECLASNQNDARTLLNDAADITVGQHGQSILAAMSQGREPLLKPTVAILASLFVPLRGQQGGLPISAACSLFNAELRNHLERLIPTYVQILCNGDGDQITFPSGHAIQQQSVVNGSITADFKKGGKGRDRVFEDITDGDSDKAAQQIEAWRQEGIEYDPAEQYKLKLPVRNINDVLLTHTFLASNFGDREIDDRSQWGIMAVYAGQFENDEIYPTIIPVDGSNFLTGIAELKRQAEAQQAIGHNCIRVAADRRSEILDIAALRALDPDNMEDGRAYAIGNRNLVGDVVSQDIPRLALRKLDGPPPTFEIGTLLGSTFEKEDLTTIEIYSTEIKKPRLQDLKPFAELGDLRQPFANGIRKAFPSGAGSMGDMSWVSTRARVRTHKFK